MFAPLYILSRWEHTNHIFWGIIRVWIFGALVLVFLALAGLIARISKPAADLGPLEADDPFAAIRGVRTSWSSGAVPALDGVKTGPRTAHDPARGARTLEAYRAWAGRSGRALAASQSRAILLR